ncbi:MAG: Gfo/Idh/MocA family protein [Planctomycetia bacterium]
MSRMKVGVVGCGHLGAIHARLLAARPDVELVGVVDPSLESRTRVAEAHGCRSFESPRDLVGAVDAAVVAAPTGLHAAVSLPLLEAGIDLLVEKPIAATVEDARAIVIAARRHGRVVVSAMSSGSIRPGGWPSSGRAVWWRWRPLGRHPSRSARWMSAWCSI